MFGSAVDHSQAYLGSIKLKFRVYYVLLIFRTHFHSLGKWVGASNGVILNFELLGGGLGILGKSEQV